MLVEMMTFLWLANVANACCCSSRATCECSGTATKGRPRPHQSPRARMSDCISPNLRKTPLLSTFPMFVPSLSDKMIVYNIYKGLGKKAFFAPRHEHEHSLQPIPHSTFA